MSSIESMVLEIEEDYSSLLKFLEEAVPKATYEAGQLSEDQLVIPEQVLLTSLRSVMNFQRKIEYSIDKTQKLLAKTEHSERLARIDQELMERLCDYKQSFYKITFYYNDVFTVNGIIPHLRSAHKQFLGHEFEESRRNYYCAYFGFRLMHSSLIELEEELRLISALTTYPIEKRTTLKNQLVVNDFEEVAVSLEEAESNAEEEHFKDCVSRCRDAVEILVATIREKETGEKTEKYFATDLGKIAKLEVFDEATQKLAQGVYSFLSLKGSHKYDAEKVTVYDAETSLKETYSLIEMLLKKLSDYKKSKEKQPKT